MKAIILAAGYATRLYPLTKNRPKALLPINNKPIIDYIVDEINTVDSINEIIVISNDRFYTSFLDWSKETKSDITVTVLNDGTDSNENRLGAIGDIQFAIDEKNIDEEIVVIAGDNFFTYKLLDYYNFYREKDGDCICAKRIDDKELLKRVAIGEIDENNKVIGLEEKPEKPKSNLSVYASYFYKKDTLPLIKKYLDEGNNPDAPGHFPVWLHTRKDVYLYEIDGDCYDIGTHESYKEIQELYKGK